MCNPAAAMGINMVISTGAKMASEAMQAKREEKQAKRDAKIAEKQGQAEMMSQERKLAREQARRRVLYHKGGVTTEGSPTDLMLDAAQEGSAATRMASLPYSERAWQRAQDAKTRRQRTMLDQLSGVSSLNGDLINLWDRAK